MSEVFNYPDPPYNGRDGELYFCHACFLRLYPHYREFKESEEYASRVRPVDPSCAAGAYAYALRKRVAFQEMLNVADGEGHMFHIKKRLLARIEACREEAEDINFGAWHTVEVPYSRMNKARRAERNRLKGLGW